MGGSSKQPKCSKSAFARVLLVAVNAAFVAVGIALLVFTRRLDNSGWLHTVEGTEYDWVRTKSIWVFTLLGVLVLCVSLIGLCGAWCRQKWLLVIYFVCVLVVFVVFLVVAIISFVLHSELHEWQQEPFPAKNTELTVAKDFNEVYCYALGGYFCDSVSVAKALSIFAPNASEAAWTFANSVDGTAGVLSLCSNLTEQIKGFDDVCKACRVIANSRKATDVLKWVQDTCPATLDTTTWCASMVITGKPGEVYTNSPYKECRSDFLDVAQRWARDFGWICTITTLTALIMLVATCAMCCKKRQREIQEQDDEHPYTDSFA